MSIGHIRLADDGGLSNVRPENIEIMGGEVSRESWSFRVGKDLAWHGGGDLIWVGPLRRSRSLFLRAPMVNLFIAGLEVHHDFLRWPLVERRLASEWRRTRLWGRPFGRDAGGALAEAEAAAEPNTSRRAGR